MGQIITSAIGVGNDEDRIGLVFGFRFDILLCNPYFIGQVLSGQDILIVMLGLLCLHMLGANIQIDNGYASLIGR